MFYIGCIILCMLYMIYMVHVRVIKVHISVRRITHVILYDVKYCLLVV